MSNPDVDAEELHRLRDLVNQLRADNERLGNERSLAQEDPGEGGSSQDSGASQAGSSGSRNGHLMPDDHLHRLGSVLSRLQQEGLKVKLSKCEFFKKEVKYLGHVISADGVSTDPDKIAAVAGWPHPNTTTEMRSFLGFASYYRRFVQGFAKVAAPLHQLVSEVQRAQRWSKTQLLADSWTEECEMSFNDLKAKLVSAPVLAYANFSLPFILEIDASFNGLGAVLSQEQEGKVRPIAYASQGLKPTEKNMSNYSSMKLEFLALKWAITEKFRDYLLGQTSTVWTDNNPLSHLETAKLGATEQRWAAKLASFDFTIRYRSG
uniref:Reverse transcriptase/retrotransposon-derived protein RNase H-like domain-containing protein n=1 Tax=Amphiprion ocellaris TaxID=80972 RepID=A0AAQ5ZUW2_AMPOC